jgi:hypothetical protein
MQRNALSLLNEHPQSPIFHVDLSASVSDTFEHAFPVKLQQEFNCSTCRNFMRLFGDLALVDDSGRLRPLFWDATDSTLPHLFKSPAKAVTNLFNDCKVTQEFRITASSLRAGTKEAGGWKHMSFEFPSTRVQTESPVGFTTAATSELASMLQRVLDDYNLETIQRAAVLLLENKLPYADKHKASIRWLLELKESKKLSKAVSNSTKHNLLYNLAASAFVGCLNQLRSGALATLLLAAKEGASFEVIELRWKRICDPLQYMRPQVAPSAGNIAAAEKLFESLGLTKEDMRREFLRPNQIPEEVFIYGARPTNQSLVSTEGIFSEVVPKGPTKANLPSDSPTSDPPKRISFSNFVQKIIPTAKKVEFQLPEEINLFFLITGIHGSKPLMQWHTHENLVSWYTFKHPTPVKQHNLTPGWTQVSYIVPFPHLWDGLPATKTFPLLSEESTEFKYYHKQNGFRFLIGLEGVKETRDSMGLCLFPTLLKNEFHGVRSTIEAFSRMGKVERPLEMRERYVGGVSINRSDTKERERVFRVMNDRGQSNVYEIVLFE